MKVIILIFCLFSIGFAVCTEENLKKISKVKYKEENKKEFEEILKIVTNDLGNGIKKFKDKSLSYQVGLTIDEKGEFCYYSIKKSNNEEYNKFIEEFIKNESGKTHYNDKTFKRININIIPE